MGTDHLDNACRAHTNLSMFAAVVALLESGSIYGGVGSDRAAEQIIKLAIKEQDRLLKVYDKAASNVTSGHKEDGR